MQTQIRALIIEDSEDDTKMLVRVLQKGGFDPAFQRIETAEALREALTRQEWDMVFSDFGMPCLNAFNALSIVREISADIPFLIVSGTIGEERAVEAMKAGASDYLLKDNLKRLLPAVRRELAEFKKRKELRVELKKRESEVRHLQKLEGMGRLAGGVSHDFNNILSVIGMCCELALDRSKKDAATCELLREIEKAQQKGAALTRQLLAFSRKQLVEPRRFSVNDLLRDLQSLLRRVVPENTHFTMDLAPDLGTVLADPGQIEQILLNLVMNARDAVPSGGKILVRTENMELNGNRPQRVDLPVEAGLYVCVTVEDNGTGMSEETLSRLFEPFFTTKEVGRGTGLGLASVYGIIKQAKGTIDVTSRLGVGSVFQVFLPRVDGEVDSLARRGVARLDEAAQATKRILVVEDEEPLRLIIARLLRESGFHVLEAGDGEQALAVLDKEVGTIDLVVTDIVMPKMGGVELVRQALKKRKDIRVLYLSGYAEDVLLHHGVSQTGSPFLAKPFRPKDMLQKVAEILA